MMRRMRRTRQRKVQNAQFEIHMYGPRTFYHFLDSGPILFYLFNFVPLNINLNCGLGQNK